jgi:hypothetical protein
MQNAGFPFLTFAKYDTFPEILGEKCQVSFWPKSLTFVFDEIKSFGKILCEIAIIIGVKAII